MKKINVAISITISPKVPQSIWTNGGNQHAFFMYVLFKQMPNVKDVWLVCDTKADDFSEAMFAEDFKEDIHLFSDVLDKTDLLLEMSAYINTEHAEVVRRRGGKLVSYKFGNDYVMATESLSLGAHDGWVPHPARIEFDEVWTNAQHSKTCLSFLKHLYKAQVHVLPHVWAPLFLEKALKLNSHTALGWPYRKRPEKARISIFEPNINVVKSTIIPFYAASKFADQNPGQVSKIYMLNTLKLAESAVFTRFVSDTEVGKKGIASAEKRMPFVDFMGQHGGIIVCHQWENALNYIYYEALYGGFPLVHNSPFIKDLGYYYPDFDIDAAAAAIQRAWDDHDASLQKYTELSRNYLQTISPYSETVIEDYSKRVAALWAG